MCRQDLPSALADVVKYRHNWIVCLHDGWVDTENDCVSGLAEYTLTEIWYRLKHYVKHFDELTDPRDIQTATRSLNREQ